MKKILCPSLTCLLAISFLMMSCGKKAANSSSQSITQEPSVEPVSTDNEEYLSKQKVVCEEGEVCPNYMVKIVVFDNHKNPKICTGFLVNSKTVATSTSCLPDQLRLKDQDCSLNAHFFFPQTNTRDAERVGCSKVLQVSDIDNKNPLLWRDNVAFLELGKSMLSRRSLEFDRDGLENHMAYTLWGIDQIDDKTAFIRRQSCSALHNSWVNPLASSATSPNMTFTGCVLKNGNTGAPILDAKGRVRGMISEEMNKVDREYIEATGLLTDKLKPMFYATNFSCAPTIFDSVVKDEKECFKILDSAELKKSRDLMMLEREDFYENKRKQLETKLSNESRFFNFKVTLVPEGDMKRAVITPKCFKNVEQWIYTLNTSRGNYSYDMNFPQLAIKRTMDSRGRFGAADVDNGKVDYKLQFSVKMLRNMGFSDVYLYNASTQLTYRNITETCR